MTARVNFFDACRKAGLSRSRMRPGQRVQLAGWHDFVTLGGFERFKALPSPLSSNDEGEKPISCVFECSRAVGGRCEVCMGE
jgi:hypothetical protein